MDYESLIVSIAELKEELEKTNEILHIMMHAMCDFTYGIPQEEES